MGLQVEINTDNNVVDTSTNKVVDISPDLVPVQTWEQSILAGVDVAKSITGGTGNSPSLPGTNVIPVASDYRSSNFVSGEVGWRLGSNGVLEAVGGIFSGNLKAGSIDIPNTTTANSFHVDSDGNAWWGATSLGSAIASVTKAGAASFTSITTASNANATWNLLANGGTNIKFGSNGSDGALSISSGTTTVSLGGAAYVVKNYSSISITGTGKLAFSNPHANGTVIELKVQGGVTLTSSTIPNIDASGMGAAGGAAASGVNQNGNDGTVANYIYASDSSNGKAGTNIKTGGAGGVIYTLPLTYTTTQAQIYRKYQIYLTPGSGGGSGATVNNVGAKDSGKGGRGGGALYIECGGLWNFTSTLGISVAGLAGDPGVAGGASNVAGSGGGGGGAAGMCVVLYNLLTANTGTINVSGGNGGNGGDAGTTGSGADGAGGGAGGGEFGGAGGNGGTGATGGGSGNGGNGSNGANSVASGAGGGVGGTGGAHGGTTAGGGAGGGGAAGEYLLTVNSEWA